MQVSVISMGVSLVILQSPSLQLFEYEQTFMCVFLSFVWSKLEFTVCDPVWYFSLKDSGFLKQKLADPLKFFSGLQWMLFGIFISCEALNVSAVKPCDQNKKTTRKGQQRSAGVKYSFCEIFYYFWKVHWYIRGIVFLPLKNSFVRF